MTEVLSYPVPSPSSASSPAPTSLRVVPAAAPGGPAVAVVCSDFLVRAGVVTQLTGVVELRPADDPAVDVVVVVAGEVDDQTAAAVRRAARGGMVDVVLVVSLLDERALLAALSWGVRTVLPRQELTPSALVDAIRGVRSSRSSIPAALVDRIVQRLHAVDRDVLASRGMALAGLSRRERDVLTLAADGLSNTEIADRLAYSERTIKSVLGAVCVRVQAKNRTQAVAIAIRQGWL